MFYKSNKYTKSSATLITIIILRRVVAVNNMHYTITFFIASGQSRKTFKLKMLILLSQ